MLTKYLRVILFLCVLLWGTSVVDAQTKGIVVDGVKGRSLSDRQTEMENLCLAVIR